MWKSDGTSAGTVLLKDINPGGNSSYPANFVNVAGTLYFTASDGQKATELWRSDGTSAGTVTVASLNPGGTLSSLTAVGGAPFFVDSDPTAGKQLWMTEGSPGGTACVASDPSFMVALGNDLLFGGVDAAHGREPWLLKKVIEGAPTGITLTPSSVTEKQPVNTVVGTLQTATAYSGDTFTYTLLSGTDKFWIDGSQLKTCAVLSYADAQSYGVHVRTTVQSGARAGLSYDTTLTVAVLMLPQPPNGDLALSSNAVYVTSPIGTVVGTLSATDPNPGDVLTYSLVGGDTSYFSVAGNLLKTAAPLGSNLSYSLTVRVTDSTNLYTEKQITVTALPLGAPGLLGDINTASSDSSPANFVAAAVRTFFTATDVLHGTELWKTDGTSSGTVLVKDIWPGPLSSNISGMTSFNGLLYFSANDGSHGNELWRSDGTSAGTYMLVNLYADTASFTYSSSPTWLTVMGSKLYFAANDGVTGAELWQTDGTSAGTALVKDIWASNSSGSSPAYLTVVNNTLYFAANDGTDGTELWKSDGTSAGTVMVKDIWSGSSSSAPMNFKAVGNTLFFAANDGGDGTELWKSDGTSSGTVMVRDIFPGAGNSSPSNLTAVGSTLFFTANDGTDGTELWKSDGTSSGTALVGDIYAGSSSSTPQYLTNLNGAVLLLGLYPDQRHRVVEERRHLRRHRGRQGYLFRLGKFVSGVPHQHQRHAVLPGHGQPARL